MFGKMQVPEEQMFVDVTAHQPFLQRRTVQKPLPFGDGIAIHRRDRIRRRIRCAEFQPAQHGSVFPRIEPGQAVRHAPIGIGLGKRIELFDTGALLLPVEREIEAVWQSVDPWQGAVVLELKHPGHHAAGKVRLGGLLALVQHRIERALAPFRRGSRILEQTRQARGDQPRAVVDLGLVGTPIDALVGRQIELARCVVTAVADRAATVEDGLDVAPEVDRTASGSDRVHTGSLDTEGAVQRQPVLPGAAGDAQQQE